MSVYSISGEVIASIYDIEATVLSHAYDLSGNDAYSGEVKPNRSKETYDYYADADPDKSYTWTYSLIDLKALQNGNFTIGVQTDTHYSSEAKSYGTPLKNMTKQLYFDFICNLGDIPRGYSNDTVTVTETAIETMLERYTSYVESPVIAVYGNHDNANMSGSFISKLDMHDYYIGSGNGTLSDLMNPTGQLYYYKDFYECRVIVLDTENYPNLALSSTDININHHTFSTTQIDWLENVALDTDKPVLILSHNVLVTDVYPSVMVVPSSDTAINNSIPYNAEKVVAALENFVSNGGTVVACLSGHIHEQLSAKVNGINYISFDNGGTFAEILFIDFDNREITTKVINNSNLSDRTFTF